MLVSRPLSDALGGELKIPGDKSVSHRSLMFLSLADGIGRVSGLLEGEDCLRTADAMRAMGVKIERCEAGSYTIHGVGLRGLRAPAEPIDLGNSGTGMRLLCGLLAAQSFASELIGDASLSVRPMRRVTGPLGEMGARIETENGHAPLHIAPAAGLKGIRYEMPIASAQLKSALLIAGLYADGETELVEPGPSRDHTERMLAAMGARVGRQDNRVSIQPADRLEPLAIEVPSDLSSAAFFMVAASLVPGSRVLLPGVGVNPSRDGVIAILRQMGADIRCHNERQCGGEPVADIEIRAAALRGVSVDEALVPLAIDEFPVLFVAAALAQGVSQFRGLAELRHKESDRIGVMTTALKALGCELEEGEDWVTIHGGQLSGGRIDSHGDHRVAMAFAVAGAVAKGQIMIEKPQNIATSFPNFVDLAKQCGLDVALLETPA